MKLILVSANDGGRLHFSCEILAASPRKCHDKRHVRKRGKEKKNLQKKVDSYVLQGRTREDIQGQAHMVPTKSFSFLHVFSKFYFCKTLKRVFFAPNAFAKRGATGSAKE